MPAVMRVQEVCSRVGGRPGGHARPQQCVGDGLWIGLPHLHSEAACRPVRSVNPPTDSADGPFQLSLRLLPQSLLVLQLRLEEGHLAPEPAQALHLRFSCFALPLGIRLLAGERRARRLLFLHLRGQRVEVVLELRQLLPRSGERGGGVCGVPS